MPDGWSPFTFRDIPAHTRYTLVRDLAEGTVVRADADGSGSALYREVTLEARAYPVLRWRWKAQQLPEGVDLRRKDRDDAPARVYVAFRHVPSRVPLLERVKYEIIRLIYGRYPPHASLAYVWGSGSSAGTMFPSPYTDRVRIVVVESGAERLGRWLRYGRNYYDDYRRAFAEEPPPVAGVAIMTDSDNTGSRITAYYGDIELLPAR